MIQQVHAIYDHGVLRPLTPLDLCENEEVVLTVEKATHSTGQEPDLEPTLFDVLDEVRLVGSIKDAPPDLSTNRKYMEDFGKSG